MNEHPVLDEHGTLGPNHSHPKLDEQIPARFGTVAGRIKRWDYEDTPFTYANGKPLATLSQQIVMLIQLDNGSTTLNYSAVATSQGWRADIFITTFLRIGGGGSFAQCPLPVVQCFCGTQNVFAKVDVDPAYFDPTASVYLNYAVPKWARCTSH